MPAFRAKVLTITALLVLACLLAASAARAQDIEPRQYANTPVGVNFLISGYAYTQGGLSFDPALPISKPDLETSSAVLGFARSLDFWGAQARSISSPHTLGCRVRRTSTGNPCRAGSAVLPIHDSGYR